MCAGYQSMSYYGHSVATVAGCTTSLSMRVWRAAERMHGRAIQGGNPVGRVHHHLQKQRRLEADMSTRHRPPTSHSMRSPHGCLDPAPGVTAAGAAVHAFMAMQRS